MANAYILQNNRIVPQILHTARASHYEHYPLVKGNIAPSFRLGFEDRISPDATTYLSATDKYIKLDELLLDSGALVIAFYTPGKQNKTALLFFETLQASLLTKGSRLLIITGSRQTIINRGNPALNSLQIFKDRHNIIARSFGLYDPQNPLWNWVPGVEESETFLPAFYVIAPDKQIIYHHVDYNFSLFNERDPLYNSFTQRLLDAVEKVTHEPAYYPVSYKLVS